jgi:hypothetical protein
MDAVDGDERRDQRRGERRLDQVGPSVRADALAVVAADEVEPALEERIGEQREAVGVGRLVQGTPDGGSEQNEAGEDGDNRQETLALGDTPAAGRKADGLLLAEMSLQSVPLRRRSARRGCPGNVRIGVSGSECRRRGSGAGTSASGRRRRDVG